MQAIPEISKRRQAKEIETRHTVGNDDVPKAIDEQIRHLPLHQWMMRSVASAVILAIAKRADTLAPLSIGARAEHWLFLLASPAFSSFCRSVTCSELLFFFEFTAGEYGSKKCSLTHKELECIGVQGIAKRLILRKFVGM